MDEIQDINRRSQAPKPVSANEGFLQTRRAEANGPNTRTN